MSTPSGGSEGQELGWVGGHTVRSVRAFVEKPDLGEAERGRASGALWNTMVLAGMAATFWALARKYLTELMPHFDRLREAIGTPHETGVLHSIYEVLPPRNFSSHLLEKAWAKVAVLQLEGVLWSDWGRPERIMQTLDQIGRR